MMEDTSNTAEAKEIDDLEQPDQVPPLPSDQEPRPPRRVSSRRRSSIHPPHRPSTHRSSSIHFLDIQDSSNYLAEAAPADEKTAPSEGKDEETPPSSFPWIKAILVGTGMTLGFILCFITIEDNRQINQTMAIAIWMATLWISEAIPLVVTSFLPLVLFPYFGILSSGTVAVQYMNNTIWLLISGFFLALTLERWNLHRRFSLKVLTWCGTRAQLLLLGMMGATFFLSMFVSNTATTLMMVPNAISVCTSLETSVSNPSFQLKSKKFAIAMMLGIAYSANVGGMSSLIGTPPNLVFQRQLELLFPDAPEFTFSQWIGFGLPVGLIFFFIIWGYLCLVYLRDFTKEDSSMVDPTLFVKKYEALGRWSREQVMVTTAFSLACLLWLFRADLNFGDFKIPGWSKIFPEPSYISDGTTGMTIAFFLFLMPARSVYLADEEDSGEDTAATMESVDEETAPLMEGSEEEEDNEDHPYDTTLLDWETANKIPYDVVFLLGGGFALAKGFVTSGLSQFLGDKLSSLDISLSAMVFVMITLIIWLTELTSNTSTADIMIIVAASIAVATESSPYTYMIPAAMACSCAFVLPIATPPNMVVFSTGRLPMREMNKAGILLNIVGSLVLLGAAFSIIPAVTGVDGTEFPEWAQTSNT